MPVLHRLVLCLVLGAAGAACDKLPEVDLVLVDREPVQASMPRTPRPSRGAVRVEAVARYDVTALVLGTKAYADDMASAAPLDFALGWAAASNPAAQNELDVWQANRWFHWRMPRRLEKLNPGVLSASMANVHIVPGTPELASALTRVRRGDLVRLTGHLVDLFPPTRTPIRTSLSRTDQGAGACEVLEVLEAFVWDAERAAWRRLGEHAPG